MVFLFVFLLFSIVYADDDITVRVNGDLLVTDQPAVIIDGRTLVPLRAICERLNCTVDWNDKTKTATIQNKITTIAVKLDNYTITKRDLRDSSGRDTKIIIDVPPQIINGRTMVPARAISEAFNARVDWNGDTRTVNIIMEYDYISDYADGLATVRKGDMVGFIDKDGIMLSQFECDKDVISASITSDMAVFREIDKATGEYKYGFMNLQGKVIVPAKYFYIRYVNGTKGVFAIRETVNGKLSIYSKAYRVFDFVYDSAGYQTEYGYFNIEKNGKFGIVNEDGKVVIPTIYEQVEGKNGYFAVCNNGKWGLVDPKNFHILESIYDAFGGFTASGCLFGEKGSYMNYDFKTKQASKKFDYEYMHSIPDSDDYIAKKDGKFGLVDKTMQNVIITFNYDEITPFISKKGESKDAFLVKGYGKYGIVDRNEAVIVPLEYDALYMAGGRDIPCILANVNGKCGVINWQNKVLLPLEYDSCPSFWASTSKGHFDFIKDGVEEHIVIDLDIEN